MGRGASNSAATSRISARSRAGSSEFRVDPNFQASDEEVFQYSYGDCHSLAYALHKLTNWPLTACNYDERGIPDHIFVVNPQGQGVDIHGAWERGQHPDGLVSDWKPISLQDLERMEGQEFDVINPESGEFTAKMLLGIAS